MLAMISFKKNKKNASFFRKKQIEIIGLWDGAVSISRGVGNEGV